jgi:hypothetical protein
MTAIQEFQTVVATLFEPENKPPTSVEPLKMFVQIKPRIAGVARVAQKDFGVRG